MYKLILTILILPLFVLGCSSSNGVHSNQNGQESITLENQNTLSFLKAKGYSIVTSDGKVQEYILKKELLINLPYSQIWGVQSIDAKDYFDKTIETFKFTVKNHPLDNLKGNQSHQTRVWVMVCENKAIGGFSLPDEDVFGGVYSLDGKTLEEVTGLNYQDWSREWNTKYNTQKVQSVTDYATLISALREKGYSIEEKELEHYPNEHQLFSVPPKVITVEGENVSIYEFSDSDTAKSQSQTISKDGSFVGKALIEWIAPPHFYFKGRIIVCYIGRNQALINNLAKIIGDPITTT